ncbi:MAG: hypothetical protein K6C13_09545 [Oscillospiraceae bacterium]|nr:hypothetical protein [Oscillospiraceae bacterium]
MDLEENEKRVVEAAELIYRDTPAAVVSGHRIIWRNEEFSYMEEDFGEEFMLCTITETIGSGEPERIVSVRDEEFMLNIHSPDDCCVVTVTRKPLFIVMPPGTEDIFSRIVLSIRKYVSLIALSTDEIFSYFKDSKARDMKRAYIADQFETLDRSLLCLYSEMLLDDEVLSYNRYDMTGVCTSLNDFCEELCGSLRHVFRDNSDFSISYECEEGLFAVFRPETLKIILMGLLVSALKKKNPAEYFRIVIKKMGNTAVIVAEAGSLSDYTEEMIPLDHFRSFDRILPSDDLYNRLIQNFCSHFSSHCAGFNKRKMSAIYIRMPLADMSNSSVRAPLLFKAYNNRFSIENAMLADVVKSRWYYLGPGSTDVADNTLPPSEER